MILSSDRWREINTCGDRGCGIFRVSVSSKWVSNGVGFDGLAHPRRFGVSECALVNESFETIVFAASMYVDPEASQVCCGVCGLWLLLVSSSRVP